MNLVLVGVRGSGKSTAGTAVASRLGFELVDLDREIEKLAGKTLKGIFDVEGEEGFRRLETRTLSGLGNLEQAVVATGGGVVTSRENRRLLRSLGPVVWLRVGPREAVARLAGCEDRPRLTELPALQEAEVIAKRRYRYYQEVADHIIDTDGRTALEVCDALEQLWNNISDHHVR